MRTAFKKAVSVLLATAVVVSGVTAADGSKAEAAKKKTKTYTAECLFAGIQGSQQWTWLAGDAKPMTKKIKITKGKKTKVSFTVTTKKKIKGATVFTVDLKNILKDYKKNKIKISGLTVKADGKKKSTKLVAGCFEPNKATSKYNYRVSIYNSVGTNGDNSKSKNKSKNYAFKKKLQVSFTVVAK